jgi:alpha-tubulin suppressor-like RCC1 family protein
VNGKLFSFGSNRFGQLGHGDEDGRNRPFEMTFFKNEKNLKLSCGSECSFAICGKI